MKIYFPYYNSIKEIYFDNVIIFHGNINNQIKLYDEIVKGLQGNSKGFLLNNLPVNKKELNVIEFSNNTLFDDLKLTSKSYNLKILESVLDDDEVIIQSINEVINDVELKIQDKYRPISKEYAELFPSIHFQNLKKIILDNFSLVDKDKVNISLQIELQLMVILNYVRQNSDKFFFIVIKHFNHFLDISQMTYILNSFQKIKNGVAIVFVKSFELFEYYDQSLNYMIKDFCIEKMVNDYELTSSKLLSIEENEELIKYITARKRYKRYCQIVNEKQ